MRTAALNALVLTVPQALAFRNDLASLLVDLSEEERFRGAVAQTLVAFAVELAATSDGEASAIGNLNQTLAVVSEIQRILEEKRPEMISKLEPVIQGLRLKQESVSKASRAWVTFLKDPWSWPLMLLLPPLLCLPVWYILLSRSPKWIWRINALLERFPESKAPSGLNLPFGLRGYLLISLFQYHPRVLDAWLDELWPAIRAAFESIDVVGERRVHAPVQASFNGGKPRELVAEDFRHAFRCPSVSVLIHGGEGMGKTSLAFRIARWAMSESLSDCLADHRMVPVLIEEKFQNEATTNLDEWITRIERALSSVLGATEGRGTALTLHLLRTKRLLLILDDAIATFRSLSSLLRTNAVAKELLRALIVCTPLREPNRESFDLVVEPMPVEISNLGRFFHNCLGETGERDQFRDGELLEACVDVHRAAGWPAIPVWIARLWADSMVRSKNGAGIRERPKHLAELLVRHVEARNDSVPAGDRLDLAVVIQTLKKLAWQCLKSGDRAGAANRTDVQRAFDDQTRAHERIGYLEKRLRLIRCGDITDGKVRVRSEPLAHHFAALHICEMCGSDSNEWGLILNEIAGAAEKSDPVRRFFRVLHQTFLVKADAFRIPETVVAQVGALAARFASDSMRDCAELQVKRMTCQLMLPNIEDRMAAAKGLSRLGISAAAAIPALVSRLNRIDEGMSVRLEIVETLGRIGHESDSAVSALIRVLKEPFTVLRPAASRALVRIGSKAQAGLADVLKGSRRNAAFGLTVLKTICNFESFDEQTVETLRALVVDSGTTDAVRRGGTEALAKAGSAALSSVTDLIALMLEKRALCRSAANAIAAIAPDTKASVISLFEALDGRGSRGSEETLAMFRDSLLQAKKPVETDLDPEISASIRQAFDRALAVARSRATAASSSTAKHAA